MSGNAEICCACCCEPSCRRESFIGRETIWTGWHRRPPPRDPWDTRDKCALRCAVDPEKKKEVPKPRSPPKEAPGSCEEPPYFLDYDPNLALVKKQLDDGKVDVSNAESTFANTAVGIVGKRRESMLENRLLHRHQVGIPLKCCRDMPCDDFIFGKPYEKGWTMMDALRGWAGTGLQEAKKQRGKKLPRRLCCIDFLALNRAANNVGVTTAKEFRNYRNTHCLGFSKFSQRGMERLPPPVADKDAIYGAKSNYVTTMKELLSDQELREWQQGVKYCMRERQMVKTQNKADPWKENTACLLRTIHNVKGPQTESVWHMPKFETKAKPHLCTFRTDGALLAAHKANQLDHVGRDGIFGEGITTKAINRKDLVYLRKD